MGQKVRQQEGCPSGQRRRAVNPLAQAYVGSNPTPSSLVPFAGVAQMVEHQPSKLRVAGSNPVSRWRPSSSAVERVLGKDEVVGSIPTLGLLKGSWLGIG